MTGTRRGRPPGSKSRTSEQRLFSVGATAAGPGSSTTAPVPPGMAPTTVVSHERRDWSLPAPTIRVVLSFRKATGDEATEREVDWPAAWRLPQQGERIHLAADWGGIVSTLDFDFERSAVVIFLR